MHKIFSVPELLDEILSDCSRHTKTVATRVCWTWFTRSVPIIWERVQLNDILSVLSPFNVRVKVRSTTYALGVFPYFNRSIITSYDDGFQQPVLLPQSWERFFLYSKHIRCLECIDVEYTALTQTTLQRPSDRSLFSSNLTTLIWHSPGGSKQIMCLLPLLTPMLQFLHFSLYDSTNPDKIDLLCKTIVKRSPSLRVLRIDIPALIFRHQVVSRSLGELVRYLSELTVVLIPISFVTPRLFTILSRLSKLEQLSLLPTAGGLALPMDADLDRKYIDHEGSRGHLPFRSLRILEISDTQLLRMVDVLGHGNQLLELIELTCSFTNETSSDQLITLVELIHILCPNLQKMDIVRNNLPWQVIQALLKYPHLVELGVSPFSKVDMEPEDIFALATNRSSWKSIVLFSSEPLSYHALIHFAQNCPDLHTLGLTLDIDSVSPDLETFTTDVRFSSLTLLDVHNSVLTSASELEVATFLSSICGHPLEIRARGDHAQSWKAIEGMVNNYAKLKLEIQTLKEEIAVFFRIYDD